VIFVLQIVAMEHVAPAKLLTLQEHKHVFADVQRDRVLPPSLMNEWRLAVALQNLKVRFNPLVAVG
jgi:hypothetical protein